MYMRKVVLTLLVTLFASLSLFAQKKITGKVTDANGKPLENVSVVIKGTKEGTTTNAEGVFTISVSDNSKSLEFSIVGMEPKEVSVNSKSFNVSLQPKSQDLTDVVVTVPYGTVKKKAFTGAENTITSASLQKQQVTSVTKALEGLIPGITATNGGGQPGEGAKIRVRGFGSINASSAPLYVVNGVPYDGNIEAISNDDIESVTVLKDAAAAALYGSRAANGVIMITTKKGKKGKAQVTVSARYGYMERGIPEYDRVDTKRYYELYWESKKNQYIAQNIANPGARASADLIDGSLIYNCYNVPNASLVDPVTGKLNDTAKLRWSDSWADELFHQAKRTSISLNISGATDATDYFLSAGYLNEEGIVKNSGYKRYTFRVSTNTTANSWLNVGIDLDGAMTKKNYLNESGSASNPFSFSRGIAPIYPVFERDPATGQLVYKDGQKVYDYGEGNMGARPYLAKMNPVGTIDLDVNSQDIYNGNVNAFAEIKFLKNFTFKTSIGTTLTSYFYTEYLNNLYGDAAPSGPDDLGGSSTKTSYENLSMTANQVLSWNKEINNDHSVRLLLGHENYSNRFMALSATGEKFLFSGMTELDNAQSITSASSSVDNNTIESYFANFNYDYNQKYLFSASYRTDGSSKFDPSVRWGKFYSVGFGWRLSQEPMIRENFKFINDLKVRASYGEQGNEALGLLYQYRNYWNASLGIYQAPSRPSNPDLKWEKNGVTNYGLDFSLFKRRLSGTIEWYNKQSDNLLFDVPLAPSSGFKSVYQNIGSMCNTGYEIQLGYNAIMKKNFNWRVDLNLSHFDNVITKLPPGQAVNGIVTSAFKRMEGHSIYDFWLHEYAGVDQQTGDALYYVDVKDAAGNVTGRTVTNSYSKASFYYKGSAIPKFSGGFTNSFNYKGFDLSVLMTFSYGGLFLDGNYASLMHSGEQAGTAWSTDIEGRWQKPGDITTIPRLQNEIADNTGGLSTRWLVDGSWLNIKNITLSYSLPKKYTKGTFSGVQVYVNVDNVYLFTAKKGMDPQNSLAGLSDANYTPYRTFTLGTTINLR